MTNYEELKAIVSAGNKDELYQWLGRFATWVDPGEYHDDKMLEEFLCTDFPKSKFKVGDILHYRCSNIYGVVTYVNYEDHVYSIITDTGESAGYDYDIDFESVDNEWEATDRKLNVRLIIDEILPLGLRRE